MIRVAQGEPEDHLGHIRYEEDPKPTLLYYGKDSIILEILK